MAVQGKEALPSKSAGPHERKDRHEGAVCSAQVEEGWDKKQGVCLHEQQLRCNMSYNLVHGLDGSRVL